MQWCGAGSDVMHAVVWCSAVPCRVVWCGACSEVVSCMPWCGARQCSSVLEGSAVQWSVCGVCIQWCGAYIQRYGAVQCSGVVLCSVVWCGAVQWRGVVYAVRYMCSDVPVRHFLFFSLTRS